jgi:NAD(P)-dependent dehydrogenase (short-subunit alcohol dehydrogenase family)
MSSSNSSNSSLALKGHHVLVTGGSQGIGAAIVVDASAEGARVSFFDIDV